MFDVNELLKATLAMKASDLHITAFTEPTARVNGDLIKLESYEKMSPSDTEYFACSILGDSVKILNECNEVDTTYTIEGFGRFRVNAYKQRRTISVVIRTIAEIPTMGDLNLPPVLKTLALKKRGLILVTGPTGSGKSTTLASMIDYVNQNKSCHILTLEDPIEYLHQHKKSIVNQREIGQDSKSFATALKSALRQDPDVILVGEMRDFETISIAITAAETGHLVLSTLHTIGAANTIDRIIDVFPTHQQQQIRGQLAGSLEGVVSQQLLKTSDENGRIAAFEIMTANTAIKNLIREGKTHQIQSTVQMGSKFGMRTMDSAIVQLYRDGSITRETALQFCVDRDQIERMLV